MGHRTSLPHCNRHDAPPLFSLPWGADSPHHSGGQQHGIARCAPHTKNLTLCSSPWNMSKHIICLGGTSEDHDPAPAHCACRTCTHPMSRTFSGLAPPPHHSLRSHSPIAMGTSRLVDASLIGVAGGTGYRGQLGAVAEALYRPPFPLLLQNPPPRWALWQWPPPLPGQCPPLGRRSVKSFFSCKSQRADAALLRGWDAIVPTDGISTC